MSTKALLLPTITEETSWVAEQSVSPEMRGQSECHREFRCVAQVHSHVQLCLVN